MMKKSLNLLFAVSLTLIFDATEAHAQTPTPTGPLSVQKALSELTPVSATARANIGAAPMPPSAQLLGGTGTGFSPISIGAGCTLSGGVLACPGTGGPTIPTANLLGGTGTALSAVSVGGGMSFSGGVLSLPQVNTSGSGTYNNITVDAFGRITAVRALNSSDVTGALGYTPISGSANNTFTGMNVFNQLQTNNAPIALAVTLPNLGSRTTGAIQDVVTVTDPTAEAAPNNWITHLTLSAANTHEVLDDHEMDVKTNGFAYTSEEHTTPGYFHAFMNDTIPGGSINFVEGVLGMADQEGVGTLNNAADFIAHAPATPPTGGTLVNRYAFYDDGCGTNAETNCYGIFEPQGAFNGFGTNSPTTQVHVYGSGGLSGADYFPVLIQDYTLTSEGVGIQFKGTGAQSGYISSRYNVSAGGGYMAIGAGVTNALTITAPTGNNSGRLGINMGYGVLPGYTLDVNGAANVSGTLTAGSATITGALSVGSFSITNLAANGYVSGTQTLTSGTASGTLRSTTTVNSQTTAVNANNDVTTVNLSDAANSHDVYGFNSSLSVITGGAAFTDSYTSGIFGHAYGFDGTGAGGTMTLIAGVVGMGDNEGYGTITNGASFYSVAPATPPTGGVLTNHYVLYDGGPGAAGAETNAYGLYIRAGENNGFGTATPTAPVHIYGTDNGSADWSAEVIQDYSFATSGEGAGLSIEGSGGTPLVKYTARYNTGIGGAYADIAVATGTDAIKIDDVSAQIRMGVGLSGFPAYPVDVLGNVNASTGFVINGGVTITSGAAVPGSTVQPAGSIYINTAGSSGSHIYISQGGGTWTAISGV